MALAPPTVALQSARTSRTTRLTHATDDTPSLILGGTGSAEEGISSTLATLAGLSTQQIMRQYGYTAQEAEKTAAYLKDITIPEGKTGIVSSDILPALKTALKTSTTAKDVQASLASSLAQRSDIAYNLGNPKARNAYAATERFKASGMTNDDLMRYASRIATLSAPSSFASAGSSSQTRLPAAALEHVPVYATSLPAYQASAFSTTRNAATFPPTFATSPQSPAPSAVPPAQTAQAVPTAMSDAPTRATVNAAQATSLPPMASTARVTPTSQSAPSFPSTRATKDPELDRLRRIEANYERDKAMLSKEKTPALARSASHDVGHAEGTNQRTVSDTTEIKRLTRAMEIEVANQIVEKLK